ncbi:MAG: VOC family protein [Verrucomicrobia bacterium]|nr:VOC family protein [Verrucomicrobiota bacterium]
MKVVEIAFCGYPVTDLGRAKGFYESILGLAPSRTYGDGAEQWVEYDLGAATLAITNMSFNDWKPSTQGPSVALEVDDFTKAIEDLRAGQVRFYLEPVRTPVCQLAVVADPDGNCVTIHQRHPHTT